MIDRSEYTALYTNNKGKATAKWLFITSVLVVFSLFCFALVFYLASHPLKPAGVEAVVVPTPDFSSITVVVERKQAFFDYLTPLISRQNNKVMARRERILGIKEELSKKNRVSNRSRKYVERMVNAYRFADQDLELADQIDELLIRVDKIPPSMVLAQAATESAWGTSRFATTGNNFFGQWCFEEGCGNVPKRRGEGQTHEVAAFDDASDSIQSYFRNINTHRAYRGIRERRAALRAAGDAIVGLELIEGLISYSARGEDYIAELRQIILGNQLEQRDQPQAPSS